MTDTRPFKEIRRIVTSFVLGTITLTSGPLYGILAMPFPLPVTHSIFKPANVLVVTKDNSSSDFAWHSPDQSLTAEVPQNGALDSFNSSNSAFFGLESSTAVQPLQAPSVLISTTTNASTSPSQNISSPSEQGAGTEIISSSTLPSDSLASSTSAFLEKILSAATRPPLAHAEESVSTSSSPAIAPQFQSAPVLEYSGFAIDSGKQASTTVPTKVSLNISLAGTKMPGAKLSVQYSTDTISWFSAGDIAFDDAQDNASNKGYFSFTLPQEAFKEPSTLKIRLAYTFDKGSSVSPTLYVDGVWIDAEYGLPFLKWLENSSSTTTPDALPQTDDAKFEKLSFASGDTKLSLPGNLKDSFTIGETAPLKRQLSMSLQGAAASTSAERINDKVIYKDAFDSTDLEYQITATGLKENIVLKDAGHPDSFEYSINLKDFSWTQVNSHQIELYRKGKNVNPLYKLYTIDAPYMEDAAGNRSDNVTLSVKGDFLTVTPDAEWLKSAKYPVKVDPSVDISVLNIHSHPVQGGYWNIDFVTNGTSDLVITPGDPQTMRDMKFTQLACDGTVKTPAVSSDGVVTYKDWSCDGIGNVTYFDQKSGNHHQIFSFGGATADAFNGNIVWSGAGTNSKWSNNSNWIGGTAPGISDMAVFDNTCGTNCNATIDRNINVLGISTVSGYTGTITLASSTSATVGSFSEVAGTFNAGKGVFVDNGSFSVTGGTFVSPNDIDYFQPHGTYVPNQSSWMVGGNFTLNGGTINSANGGRLLLFGTTASTTFSCSGDFNALTGAKVLSRKHLPSGTTFDLATGCTLSMGVIQEYRDFTAGADNVGDYIVHGTLNIDSKSLYNNGQSNMGFDTGTGRLLIVGGTVNYTPYMYDAWNSGALVISNGGTINMTSKFGKATLPSIDIVSGTLNALNFNTLTISDSVNLESSSSIFSAPTTIALGGNSPFTWTDHGVFQANSASVNYNALVGLSFLGSTDFYNLSIISTGGPTITFSSAPSDTITVDNLLEMRSFSGNPQIVLRSSSLGTQWKINPKGIVHIFDANVKDSNNINSRVIRAAAPNINGTNGYLLNTDAGNNTGWDFAVKSQPPRNSALWTGLAGDGKWSTAGNWASSTVPTYADIPWFDNRCTNCNVLIDTDVDASGFQIDTTFTGTITQATSTILRVGNFVNNKSNYGFNLLNGIYTMQASTTILLNSDDQYFYQPGGSPNYLTFTVNGGTFNGGSTGTLKLIHSGFSMAGGTFNAPGGGFDVDGDFNWATGTINGSGKSLQLTNDAAFLESEANDSSTYSSNTFFTCAGDFNSLTGMSVGIYRPVGLNELNFRMVAGTVQLNTGCTLSATVNTTGAIIVESGSTLNGTGSSWVSSDIGNSSNSAPAEGTINFTGTSFKAGLIELQSGGVLNIPNATSFESEAYFGRSTTTVSYGGTNLTIRGWLQKSTGHFNLTGKNLTLEDDYTQGALYVYCDATNQTLGLNSLNINLTGAGGQNDYSYIDTSCNLTANVASPHLSGTDRLDVWGTLNVIGNFDAGLARIYQRTGGQITVQNGTTWKSGPFQIDSGNFDGSGVNDMKVTSLYMSGSSFVFPKIFTSYHSPDDNDWGDISLNSGTVTASSSQINLWNNWSNNGATFNAGSSTLSFTSPDGFNSTFTGNSTFYNFSDNRIGPHTLLFTASSTQTVLGKLDLNSTNASTVSLRSTLTGTQWNIDMEGATSSLYNLDVKDSNSIGQILQGCSLINSGNNLRWNFTDASYCPAPTDTTPPNPGTLTLSNVTLNDVTLTVTGASDAGSGLAANPYVYTNVTTGTTSVPSSAPYTFSGLAPNTLYTFNVNVSDAVGNSATTANVATTTLANVPTNISASAETDTDISVDWNDNGNPGNTEYYILETTTGNHLGWLIGHPVHFHGLKCDTLHTFKVKGRNAFGIETAYTATTNARTKACVITPPSSGGTTGQFVPPPTTVPPVISGSTTPATIIPAPLPFPHPTPAPTGTPPPTIGGTYSSGNTGHSVNKVPPPIGVNDQSTPGSIKGTTTLAAITEPDGSKSAADNSSTSQGSITSGNEGIGGGIGPKLFNELVDYLSQLFKFSPPRDSSLLNIILAIIMTLPLLISTYGSVVFDSLRKIHSFSDLQLTGKEFGSWLMGVLGFKKHRRIWGTVYDSITKQPIDPAIVELIDVNTGESVDEAVTDLAGRYGFLVRPGKFYLNPMKTNYAFPSKRSLDSSDQIYSDLYHGEMITIGSTSDVVAPNIPMDPVTYDWAQQSKPGREHLHPRLKYAGRIWASALFWLGFAWTIYAYILYPTFINALLLFLYAAIYIITLLWPANPLWGRIYSKEDGRVLPGLLIQLLIEQPMRVVMGRAISAENGKFFLKANPGMYTLQVMQQKNEEPELLYEKNVEIGKEGLYNKEIIL